MLLLAAPVLTREVVAAEWAAAARVLNGAATARLRLVARIGGNFHGWPNAPVAAEEEFLAVQIAQAADKSGGKPARKGHAFYDVLRVLVRRWMLNAGHVTQGELTKLAGCSYPTLGDALKKLDAVVDWEGARRVHLTRFPKQDWDKLLVLAPQVRGTRYFKSTETGLTAGRLFERIAVLKADGIAFGGWHGARHYLPALDLTAPTRVDVTMKRNQREPDLGWMEGLVKPAGRNDRAALALHFIGLPSDGFVSEGGTTFADPVECLLDLEELRLEEQAAQFLEHFTRLASA